MVCFWGPANPPAAFTPATPQGGLPVHGSQGGQIRTLPWGHPWGPVPGCQGIPVRSSAERG